jgi:hypothetical protein
MEKEIFRYFLRKVHKLTEPTNEECDEIHDSFMEYLNNKCSPEQMENFMPTTLFDLISNSGHPFRTEGFHPAYILHFSEFVRINVEGETNA